jgi:pimeloyl-ACP methyl ester carboxylesterase
MTDAVPPGCELSYLTIHGHRRAFVKVGKGPVLLLLHGMGVDHTTWNAVIPRLAKHYTVLAPDLLGHGESDKPRADYSVGGYANGMRDLLTVLGIDKVTVVGHSLGGGVAMQFAYQYPERTERLVLVSPGGLGREVNATIRAVTLPGFDAAMGVLTLPGLRHLATSILRAVSEVGPSRARDLGEIADILDRLSDPRTRRAMRHVVSTCVDWRGQIISMVDRAYLTKAMPICVMWGDDDHVIPTRHSETARQIAPGAMVEIIADAGHFPHKEHPERFVQILDEFVRTTQPATYHRGRWRALLKNGAPEHGPLLDQVPDSQVVVIA